MKIESLVKHKTKLRKRTPKFIKQNAKNIKRLDLNWRKPRGSQSKMRLKKSGKPKMVSVGYKTPRALQGVLSSGFRERLVSNLDDLKLVNKKTERAVLNSALGKKKILVIIQEAKKLGVSFSNIQAENKVKDIEDFLKVRKGAKKKKAEEKKAKEKKKKASKKDVAEQSSAKTSAKADVEKKEEPKKEPEKAEDIKKVVKESQVERSSTGPHGTSSVRAKKKVDEELKSKKTAKETKEVKK